MRLKNVVIHKFRNFENVEIDFEKTDFPDVFSIASVNGGGKSTLLQFIFIMLNCMVDNKKNKYIKNILNRNEFNKSSNKVADFIIEDDNQSFYLNFIISKSQTSEFDYNSYMDLKVLEKEMERLENDKITFSKIIRFQNILNSANRVTPIIEREFRNLRFNLKSSRLDKIYQEALLGNELNNYKQFINTLLESREFGINLNERNELEHLYNEMSQKIKLHEQYLEENNKLYLLHLENTKYVLLLETNADRETLLRLSSKVYYTAPSSQIFLFLTTEEKRSIFHTFNNRESDLNEYQNYLINHKIVLENFKTYDYASTDLILESFRKSSEEDLKTKRKTGNYGRKYDELSKDLKIFLEEKEITEDEDGFRVIFRFKNSKIEILPEDLSHGELKKLAMYLWIKYLIYSDSLVLMDEPDIALHPKWQYDLINDLTMWSNNKNQFLIATHSPQIISSTYYKNIIKLIKEKDSTKIQRFTTAPLDRDINTIVKSIMDSPNFPIELLNLHKQYRNHLKNNTLDSSEAIELKRMILEYESSESSFFQDINFELELL